MVSKAKQRAKGDGDWSADVRSDIRSGMWRRCDLLSGFHAYCGLGTQVMRYNSVGDIARQEDGGSSGKWGGVSGKAHLGGIDELVCSVTEQRFLSGLSTDATTVSSRAQGDVSGDTPLG